MTKKASSSKAKASRPFLSDKPALTLGRSQVDGVVFKCLCAFFEEHPPKTPKRTDIDMRKDWPDAWKFLLYRVGSSRLLAEYLETTPMSVSRWLNGKGMTDLTRLKIEALAASLGLPSPVD